MTALRIRPRDLMTEQELIEVRTRFTWKSVALIAHAWTTRPVARWHGSSPCRTATAAGVPSTATTI